MMVRRNAFGKTWWGNAWVEAMHRIDYDTNRLPRGYTYANAGRVLKIAIEEGEVRALVQGTRPNPYKVKIRVQAFTKVHHKSIVRLVTENPAIASELSLGKVPESIESELMNKGIHLLPSRWKDLSASCSCPDWANPCKHLAAVYYLIANEIDKDPFIIFNLRGIETAELSGLGSDQAVHDEPPPSNGDALFIAVAERERRGERDRGGVGERGSRGAGESELPDLGFPAVDMDSLFALLPDAPVFYNHGDFKRILYESYDSVIRATDLVNLKEDFTHSFRGTDFYLMYDKSNPEFFVTPEDGFPNHEGRTAVVKIPVAEPDADAPAKKRRRRKLPGRELTGTMMTTGDVFDLFACLPLDITLENNSPSSRFLNITASVALAIMRAGSFIPEVVPGTDGDFTIRYIALEYNEQISYVIAWLAECMPDNFGIRISDGAVFSDRGVYEALAQFITHFVHIAMDETERNKDDKISEAFFYGKPYKAKRFEEKNTGKSIANWLERLAVRKKDISPVIRIDCDVEQNFVLHVDVENKKDPLSTPVPLAQLFSDAKVFAASSEHIRSDVSRQIIIAGDYFPQLKEILNSRGKRSVVIDAGDMARFLTNTSHILKALGIKIIIPKEIKTLSQVRLVYRARLKGAGREQASYLSLKQLLKFSPEYMLGDTAITEEEFKQIAKSAGKLVKFKDQYVVLDADEAGRMLERMQSPVPKISPMEALHAVITGTFKDTAIAPDETLERLIERIGSAEEVPLPVSLNAVLRPYQVRGYQWLYTNTVRGFGSCIADDMGLGKTVQALAMILKLKEERKLSAPVLVVCPTSVVGNWFKESQRFAPRLRVLIYHGGERSLKLKNKDMVVTTYGIIRRDLKEFAQRTWGILVLDEAQNIKNPETDQTQAVKELTADACIAMSGTPVENRLTELWSIFDAINPGYLAPLATFKKDYALPIEKYHDKHQIELLRTATAPFILRRMKSDRTIIDDLPDKNVSNEYCYLTKEQTALYQRVIDTIMHDVESAEAMQRRGLIFKLITALKQICNHPVLFGKRGEPQMNLSGKSVALIAILEKIRAVREKALIFTQYKEMGDLLAEMIRTQLTEEPLFFHGSLSRPKREEMVEKFQADEHHRTMIISLKAGGSGLNLTAATNVIHYDLWWNPAVEDQATDRTYRIGQTRNVMVHRLITLGTFEEKIDEMIRAKKELAELVVTSGETWITELDNHQLRDLFSLRTE